MLNQILLNFADSFHKHRQDLSTVLLTGNGQLWLGSDETSTIENLSFTEEKSFLEHRQYRVAEFISLPAPEDQEIDIEGLAYADHYLWLVGSHSYKRKKPKAKKSDEENFQRLTEISWEPNRYVLGRIPLVEGKLLSSCLHPHDSSIHLTAAKLEITQQGNLLTAALASDRHLGLFVKAGIPGKENGFDIEGLAINQKRIFLGLRGPVLRGWAIMLEIELEDSTAGLQLRELGQEGLYKKHFIFLNGLGIRDLCFDGEDLLILAGPTMDLDGPVQVYRLQGGVTAKNFHYPEPVLNIPFGNREEHAEGITLFNDIAGIPSLLVIYDSPAKTRLVGDAGVLADVFRL